MIVLRVSEFIRVCLYVSLATKSKKIGITIYKDIAETCIFFNEYFDIALSLLPFEGFVS